MSESDLARASALAEALRILVGRLKRRLREQSNLGDLSWSQLLVLGRLQREGPATVTTLARAEAMRPQSMGAVIAVLQEAGFVAGTPDPKDGRQTLLSITPAGGAWIDAGRAARQDWLSRALQAALSPAEQGQVAAALMLLNRLVEL